MPLYSLIALTLSLFGATFTAISALRNHYDKDVATALGSIGTQLDGIRINAAEKSETAKNAETHAKTIKRWNKVWKTSHHVPIILFWIFTYTIAILCLFNWDDLVTKVSTTAGADQEAIQSSLIGFDFLSSLCGRVVIGIIVTLNFICSLIAFYSGYNIKRARKNLEEIFKSVEDTSAKNKLGPASAAASNVGTV